MDAVRYLKEIYRMCDSFVECKDCHIRNEFGKSIVFPCMGTESSVEIAETEKLVSIVEKWSAEHPTNTRQSEFLKMFPNSRKINGILDICPSRIDLNSVSEDECLDLLCIECKKKYWLAEVE